MTFDNPTIIDALVFWNPFPVLGVDDLAVLAPYQRLAGVAKKDLGVLLENSVALCSNYIGKHLIDIIRMLIAEGVLVVFGVV